MGMQRNWERRLFWLFAVVGVAAAAVLLGTAPARAQQPAGEPCGWAARISPSS